MQNYKALLIKNGEDLEFSKNIKEINFSICARPKQTAASIYSDAKAKANSIAFDLGMNAASVFICK